MAGKKTATKTTAAKKPSLDIKDEMLYADFKVFDWLDQQTPEMAKTFSPLVAMKWQSVVQNCGPDKIADAIDRVNSIVNVGFWELSKFPDLQWRLMCAAGPGEQQHHGWVAMASARKKTTKVDALLLTIHPGLSDEELAILRSKYDRDSFKDLLLGMGLPDGEIRPLLEEFKKNG